MTRPAPRQIDTWQKAEHNAARWMTYYGYRHVRLTPAGADGGIDVTADGAAAQVKYTSQDIGRPQLQRLVGARSPGSRIELLFFTGSRYSKTAVEYANSWHIGLFRYELNGAVSPVNEAARTIASRAEHAANPRQPPRERADRSPQRTAHSPWPPTTAAANVKSAAAKLRDVYKEAKEAQRTSASNRDEQWRANLRTARNGPSTSMGRRRGRRQNRPASVEQRKGTAGCLTIVAVVLFLFFAAGLAFNPDNRSGSALSAGLTFILAPAILCTAFAVFKRRKRPPGR